MEILKLSSAGLDIARIRNGFKRKIYCENIKRKIIRKYTRCLEVFCFFFFVIKLNSYE